MAAHEVLGGVQQKQARRPSEIVFGSFRILRWKEDKKLKEYIFQYFFQILNYENAFKFTEKASAAMHSVKHRIRWINTGKQGETENI